MLAQLSRRVRSSSTMRTWTLALAAGLSDSGSSGRVGLSGLEPAGSAEPAAERIAVVSISRPCKSPPHGVGGHAGCDLAHTTRRSVSCTDRAHSPVPHVTARTAFTAELPTCQGGLLPTCNNYLCETDAMSQVCDRAQRAAPLRFGFEPSWKCPDPGPSGLGARQAQRARRPQDCVRGIGRWGAGVGDHIVAGAQSEPRLGPGLGALVAQGGARALRDRVAEPL